MKGAIRYMELILIDFLKEFSFGANGSFWTKNGTLLQLWIHSKDFFKILTIKSMSFLKRNIYFGQMGHFGPKIVWLYYSGSTARIKLKLKLKLMAFPKRYLVGVNRPFWTQNYSASSKLQIIFITYIHNIKEHIFSFTSVLLTSKFSVKLFVPLK